MLVSSIPQFGFLVCCGLQCEVIQHLFESLEPFCDTLDAFLFCFGVPPSHMSIITTGIRFHLPSLQADINKQVPKQKSVHLLLLYAI